MVDPKTFITGLADAGVDFYTGVPDSLLKNFCACLTDTLPSSNYIITANEGAAVALAAGHFLATQNIPLVFMQNSGIGNAVNPLLSLVDSKVYSLPVVLLIGWRGEPGVKDEPQHVRQGEVTLPMLESMRIPYTVLSDNEEEALGQAASAVEEATRRSAPVVIVVRKDTFSKYEIHHPAGEDFPMSREEALGIVAHNMPDNAVIVSTTGKLSRELFELRESDNAGHARDFLSVGSMGHASSIALGIALAQPERPVYCLDGDGALLMHLGAITNIGQSGLRNYTHIIFNNGAHESVGAQPTLALKLDIPAIAHACGYALAVKVSTPEELVEQLHAHGDGPRMIEIEVAIRSRADLGRPTTTPAQNRDSFMDFLKQ